MKLLRFNCYSAFTIQMRGLVLRGSVVDGSVQTGQRLKIPSSDGEINVVVGALELNRKIVDFVDSDEDIGIIVDECDDPRWADIFDRINQTNLVEPETPLYNAAEFGMLFPCEIVGDTVTHDGDSAG